MVVRTLVAMCDSEGCPHKGDGKSSLWDFCAIFKYIVDEDFNLIENCFHTYQFSMPKYMTRTFVGTRLKSHFHMIEHLRKEHECDDVCFCFWNAPHDMRVLSYYGPCDVKTVDLLVVAKKLSNNKYKSYNIGNLCEELKVESSTTVHTGLGDVLRMIEILPHLGITSPKVLKPYVRMAVANPVKKDQKANPVKIAIEKDIVKMAIAFAKKVKL